MLGPATDTQCIAHGAQGVQGLTAIVGYAMVLRPGKRADYLRLIGPAKLPEI